MEDDRTDVPERLLRQIHFEIAAGRRRARRAAALHPGSREHAERVDIWESLDAECEELRHLALGTVDSPAMTSGAGNQ